MLCSQCGSDCSKQSIFIKQSRGTYASVGIGASNFVDNRSSAGSSTAFSMKLPLHNFSSSYQAYSVKLILKVSIKGKFYKSVSQDGLFVNIIGMRSLTIFVDSVVGFVLVVQRLVSSVLYTSVVSLVYITDLDSIAVQFVTIFAEDGGINITCQAQVWLRLVLLVNVTRKKKLKSQSYHFLAGIPRQ
jgi:hypothetical protein